MSATTASANPFAGISLNLRHNGKRGKKRRHEARYVFTDGMAPKPGMEGIRELVGQGRTEEDAIEDLVRRALQLAEEVGIIGFSSPTVTISTEHSGATASTGAILFKL